MENTSSLQPGAPAPFDPEVHALYMETLAYATGELLSSPAWQQKIDGFFERLARLTGAERICLLEIRQRPAEVPSVFPARVWKDAASPGCPELPAEAPTACFSLPRWQAELAQRRAVAGSLQHLPEDERALLQGLGIQFVLAVPVFFDERWWGYVQLDFCSRSLRWPLDKVFFLQAVIQVLGAAIQRRQTERAIQGLYTSERLQRMLATRLRKVGESFNATLSFDTILDRILDQAPRLVMSDAALLLLVVEDQAVVARQRGHRLRSNPPLAWKIASQPALQRMAETHLPLTSSDPGAESMRLQFEGAEKYSSWLAAPVVVENTARAFLLLENLEAGSYTADHAALLELFTAQAALALRNAQLFAETLAALEREQHLNEITRAISSAQDLPTILHSVVRLAVELVGADCGSLAVISPDGTTLQYPSVFNMPDEICQVVELPGQGLAWKIIQTGQPQLLEDYTTHPQARAGWVNQKLFATLGVPVTTGNRVLGALGLFSCQPGKRFSRRELNLVEMVARQAAIAIENVRLFNAAQRRAHEAEKLRQAVSAVTSALNSDQVLENILVNLAEVVPYDSSALFLLEGNHLRIRAGRGFPNLPELKAQIFPLDNPLLIEMNAAFTPIIIHDAQEDPRFQRWGENSYIHGWMGLPLMARGELIGYMTIDNHLPGAYGPSEAALVQAFANEAAIALENARLFQQVQHLAITDPLTDCYNRRYFFEAAHREFERARRYNLPLTLILLDLDYFKAVNDTYGHLAGDAVLMEVARRCRQNLREVDILARYGGEEFVILLPLTPLEGGRQLAERLREAIGLPVTHGDIAVSISASQGVTELDAACPDIQALIEQADQALYHTKHKGRGQVSLWPFARPAPPNETC